MSSRGYALIGGGVFLFAATLVCVLLPFSLHTIEEGNIGIYYRQGALEDYHTTPGLNTMAPWITTVHQIKIRPQTETMPDVSTVTRDGIEIKFEGIQVLSSVNESQIVRLVKSFGLEYKRALVFDRISEELRLFCANNTIDNVYNELYLDIVAHVKANVEDSIKRLGDNGMKIHNLVIPKPKIPEDIKANYQAVKVQWTKQLVATQEQKTQKILKETENIKAKLDAEREKDVTKIQLEKELLKKQKEKERNDIEIQITKDTKQNAADLAAYQKKKQAEANKELYSPEYIKLELAKSLVNNTKFYFSGETSQLGALMANILKPNE